MDAKPRKKLKSYRFWNCVIDIYFGSILILLAMIGCFIFYSGCVSIKEYFTGELKDKWELIALPIGIAWVYFNFRALFYIVYMMLKKVQKEIIIIDKVVKERRNTVRGSYRIWNVYYKDGVFELSQSQAEQLNEGQKVELWFKPERKGEARRNIAVYI